MKYSIILPVFNGGEYFKLCVKSILGQTHDDFNLLLLDSGSSDGSIEWIKNLNHDRIKIYPTEKRLTIEENWGRIKQVPRNEFMTIIGHDDLFDKNYLQKMDELISRYPDASLYQAHFRFIDAAGAVMRKCSPMNERISPLELLKYFLNSSIDTMGTGFMMRSEDFDRIGGVPLYPKLLFADMEMWQRLTDKSYLAVEQAELFSYRRHSEATTASTNISEIIHALEKFIDYLKQLSVSDKKYAELIKDNGNTLLKQYCQGLSHKLLRTPVAKRNDLTVAKVIDDFRKLGRKLNTQPTFEPLDHFKIRLGKIIDSSAFLQSAYLSFRSLLKR
jgi:glycosyltransferase involved in cell wall biosynthesis